MEEFDIMHKMLETLRINMDYEWLERGTFTPEAFGINKFKFDRLLILLAEGGYIKGINRRNMRVLSPVEPEITFLGLRYLKEEN